MRTKVPPGLSSFHVHEDSQHQPPAAALTRPAACTHQEFSGPTDIKTHLTNRLVLLNGNLHSDAIGAHMAFSSAFKMAFEKLGMECGALLKP